MSSASRRRRARVIYVRTGYEHVVQVPGKIPKATVAFPVLMTLGLWADPEDFDALAKDLDVLLYHTAFGEAEQAPKLAGETTCGVALGSAGSSVADDKTAAPVESAENVASGGWQTLEQSAPSEPSPEPYIHALGTCAETSTRVDSGTQ